MSNSTNNNPQIKTIPYKQEFKHSYTRRRRKHDYYGKATYHIILKKEREAPDFSKIKGNAAISPGQPGTAYADYCSLGFAIAKSLKKLEEEFPQFKKHQYSIMPDHVHLILHKMQRDDYHLGDYIGNLKKNVSEIYNVTNSTQLLPTEIFEPGYTDKILFRWMNLKTWIEYVRNNPHRRAMVMQCPYFFQRVRDLEVDGKKYEAYGNLFLFRNPDKFAVRVRRRFTENETISHQRLALGKVNKGTILISPFVSKAEQRIRDNALAQGAKIILLKHEEFGERYKPAKREFELCSAGRMLIINLGLPKGTPLSYEISTRMNELAASIVNMGIKPGRKAKCFVE